MHQHCLILPQVKSAAVLLLLYISARDSDGWRKVSEAGSTVVTLLGMLSVARSWPVSAPQQLPSSALAVLSDETTETESAQAVVSDITASLQFARACSALLYNLNQGATSNSDDDAAAKLSMFEQSFTLYTPQATALLASALEACHWEPAQKPPANPGSPLARVQQWGRWRKALVASCFLSVQTVSIQLHIFTEPETGAIDMLELADKIKKQQKAALRVIEASDASAVEVVVQYVTRGVLKIEDDHYVAVGQQIERDVLVRCLLLPC